MGSSDLQTRVWVTLVIKDILIIYLTTDETNKHLQNFNIAAYPYHPNPITYFYLKQNKKYEWIFMKPISFPNQQWQVYHLSDHGHKAPGPEPDCRPGGSPLQSAERTTRHQAEEELLGDPESVLSTQWLEVIFSGADTDGIISWAFKNRPQLPTNRQV